MIRRLFLSMAIIATSAATAMAGDGVKAEILGPTTGLLRVEAGRNYVMLPVEEQAPESDVRILLDGRAETTIQVRLALTHPDYYVPLDLRKWRDKRVALYVDTRADRSSVRHAAEAVWSRETRAADDTGYADTETRYRPAYHHTPLYGWMNDPNGMYYKDGLWHLFYQWNPYGSMWGNMTWGHATSADMIHWNEQPAAVWADGLGAVFSGSCAVDADGHAGFGKGTVVGLHTSAAEKQTQSLVYSSDGLAFSRYEGNPVLTSDKECRDPKIFWDEARQAWTMVLANALEHEMMFYTSADLKEWTLLSSFGRGYGCQDGVWECPDLMRLPVRGTGEEKWVLLCNINPGGPYGGSATQYFVGQWDGTRFSCEDSPDETKWMDWGKDNYATVSFSNAPAGRHVVVGWMSNWQYAPVVPTRQYRSANTLPRDLDLCIDESGETLLCSTPSPEVESIRDGIAADVAVGVGQEHQSVGLPASGLCEIEADIDCRQATTLHLDLVNGRGERLRCHYDMTLRKFAMQRGEESGQTAFSSDFRATTLAPLPDGRKHRLRMFVDRSSVEAFDGEGRWVMTNTVFPEEPFSAIEIYADGKAKAKIKVYELKP